MEATTVIKVLKDLNTTASPVSDVAKALLSKSENLNGKEFDKEYLAAELSNHEYLRNLAHNYIDGVEEKNFGDERESSMLQVLPCLHLQNMLVYVKEYPVT